MDEAIGGALSFQLLHEQRKSIVAAGLISHAVVHQESGFYSDFKEHYVLQRSVIIMIFNGRHIAVNLSVL